MINKFTTITERQFNLAEHIITHMANQKARAHNNGQCVYRTEDGLKCAAGCTIPEILYSPEMEDNSIEHIMWAYPDYADSLRIDFGLEPEEALPILQALQSIHDTLLPENWPNTVFGFILGHFSSGWNAKQVGRIFHNAGWNCTQVISR